MQSFVRESFIQLHQMQSDKPFMVMEYWTGWYDTWGKKHNVKSADEIRYTVSRFIKYGISFNMYMFHGGTNFGFINGALHYSEHLSVVTSYDYDAVLTEAGDYTEKYFKLRKLLASASVGSLPRLPHPTPKAVYAPVGIIFYLPLFDILPYLNKVFLNDTSIGHLDENTYDLTIPKIQDCQLLRILVENQGRINYSWKIQNERKGLDEDVTINGTLLKNFTIYSLDMKMSFFKRLRSAPWEVAPEHYVGPAFYWGILNAGSSPKDTFLDLSNWHYGFVFVNGRNLGRYQDIGPQRTLYLPGPWLHPGDNEIVVFEKKKKGFYVQSKNKPQLQY